MAVYNGLPYLSEAVESILRQTLRDFEFVIVEDGSTDGGGEVLEKFARADQRIRLIRQSNRGLALALNRGCGEARGRYIARMDADDVALVHRLERQVRYLEARPELSVCGSDIEVFGAGAARRFCFPGEPEVARCHLFFYCCLSHPTVMVRHEVMDKCEPMYRAEYNGAEDFDLWCRLDRMGLRMASIPEVLLRYRRHATQITAGDGGRRAILANRIRREHLTHYGLESSADAIELHGAMGSWDYRRLSGNLVKAERWLVRLAEALPCAAGVQPQELEGYLRQIWYEVCCANSDIGWQVVRAFRASPLGKSSSRRLGCLALKSLLKGRLDRLAGPARVR